MRYIQICLRFGLNPGKLLAKSLNYIILRVEGMNEKLLWDQFSNKKNIGKIDEFKDFNDMAHLEFSPGEVQEAFDFWDRAKKKQINFD